MAKRRKPEKRTWDQLTGEDDILGTDEADEAMPVEFLRKKPAPKRKEAPRGKGPKPPAK